MPQRVTSLQVGAQHLLKTTAGKAQDSIEAGESSSSEEEDDGFIPEKTEAKFLETLLRIRKQVSILMKSITETKSLYENGIHQHPNLHHDLRLYQVFL